MIPLIESLGAQLGDQDITFLTINGRPNHLLKREENVTAYSWKVHIVGKYKGCSNRNLGGFQASENLTIVVPCSQDIRTLEDMVVVY
jgi:hypothetical protein